MKHNYYHLFFRSLCYSLFFLLFSGTSILSAWGLPQVDGSLGEPASSREDTQYVLQRAYPILSVDHTNSEPIHLQTTVDSRQTVYQQHLETLMPVWEAASSRDEVLLFNFARHHNTDVADAAMRALASMQVVNVAELLQAVTVTRSALWYLPLTTQEFNEAHIREVLAIPPMQSVSAGAFHVMGSHPNAATHAALHRFMDEDATMLWLESLHDTLRVAVEEAFALAVSRLSQQFPMDVRTQLIVTERALSAEHGTVQAAWLYGWYRSVATRLYPETTDVLRTHLPEAWLEMYGLSRQYLLAVLGRNRVDWLEELLTDEYLQGIHPLEAIELIRILPAVPTGEIADRVVRDLIRHPESSVRTQLYMSLSRFDPNSLPSIPASPDVATLQEELAYITFLFTSEQERACRETVQPDLLARVALQPPKVEMLLPLLASCVDTYTLARQLRHLIESSGRSPQLMRSVLSYLTATLDRLDHPDEIMPVLELIAGDTAPQSHAAWLGFKLAHPARVESSTRIQARVIQAENEPVLRSDDLLTPNLTILSALGPSPIWIITTKRGELHLRLDPLRSPSTVTALAILTADEAHHATPFHRVVPNFVIQSGELWAPGASGSPYFRVPTEASERSFHRGALGIASAGRDTEGSQFFVMHMWAPHLDGRYTRAGYLQEGYDVLDGLMQGDMILHTHMLPTPGW